MLFSVLRSAILKREGPLSENDRSGCRNAEKIPENRLRWILRKAEKWPTSRELFWLQTLVHLHIT